MKRFWIAMACLGLLAGCAAQQTTEKNSELAEATREIGEAYMRQGDYTAALRELIKAQNLNPDDPYVHNDLGLCYMAKERMTDAVKHFKKAIALKPEYAPARNNLGSAYLAMEQWDAAIAVFKEITKDVLYATPHFPLYNLGIAYYRKGDYAKSLDYYREALKIQPDFVKALYGIGRTYLAMNQGSLALRHLERAAQQAPKVPEIHFDLAEAYVLVGRFDQARHTYETVIDLAPSDSPLAAKARRRMGSLR